jgi:hypothetical protein
VCVTCVCHMRMCLCTTRYIEIDPLFTLTHIIIISSLYKSTPLKKIKYEIHIHTHAACIIIHQYHVSHHRHLTCSFCSSAPIHPSIIIIIINHSNIFTHKLASSIIDEDDNDGWVLKNKKNSFSPHTYSLYEIVCTCREHIIATT